MSKLESHTLKDLLDARDKLSELPLPTEPRYKQIATPREVVERLGRDYHRVLDGEVSSVFADVKDSNHGYGCDVGAPLGYPANALQNAYANIARELTQRVDEAVVQWSAQCGMTPEEWLKLWRPDVRMKPQPFQARAVTVEFEIAAVPREDVHPMTVTLP